MEDGRRFMRRRTSGRTLWAVWLAFVFVAAGVVATVEFQWWWIVVGFLLALAALIFGVEGDHDGPQG